MRNWLFTVWQCLFFASFSFDSWPVLVWSLQFFLDRHQLPVRTQLLFGPQLLDHCCRFSSLRLRNELRMGPDSLHLRHKLRSRQSRHQPDQQRLLRLHWRIRVVFTVLGVRCKLQQCHLRTSSQHHHDRKHHRSMRMSDWFRLDTTTAVLLLRHQLQWIWRHSFDSEWLNWRVYLQVKVHLEPQYTGVCPELFHNRLHLVDQ